MNCTNCGKSIAESTKFCGSCGQKIDDNGNKPESDGRAAGGLILIIAIGGWYAWSYFDRGIDVEAYSCGYEVSECRWDDTVPWFADCTLNNSRDAPIKTADIRTWSFSESGTLLGSTNVASGIVPKGRSIQLELKFKEDASRAYLCPRWLDPESGDGKKVIKDTLHRLVID